MSVARVLVCMGLSGWLAAQAQTLPPAQLLGQLQRGGLVIVMRHANAPTQAPDAVHADSANTRRERQLDESGRADAQGIGLAIRTLGIPVAHVLCSPTYRARETAQLLGLGTCTVTPQLDEPPKSMQSSTDPASIRWLRTQVSQVPPPRSNSLLITHLPNIRDSFGQSGEPPRPGEALIFRPDARGGAQLVERLQPRDWSRLQNASSPDGLRPVFD